MLRNHHNNCIHNPAYISKIDLDSFIKQLPSTGNCPKCQTCFTRVRTHARKCFKNCSKLEEYLPSNIKIIDNSINQIKNSIDKCVNDDNLLSELPFFNTDTSDLVNFIELGIFKTYIDKIMSKIMMNDLNLIHININGIRGKLFEVFGILNLNHIDILMINESKLDKDVPNGNLIHQNYNLLRLDRGDGWGGGVLVYISKSYEIIKFDYTDFETIYFQLKINGLNINFISSYKSPTYDNMEYLLKLEDLLFTIDKSEPLFVIGDLNMNLYDSKGAELREFLINNDLKILLMV